MRVVRNCVICCFIGYCRFNPKIPGPIFQEPKMHFSIYMENNWISKLGFFFIWLLNFLLAKYLFFSATILVITS